MEPRMDVLDRFHQAVAAFDAAVRAVGSEQWALPTPDAEWSVRDLVQHVVYEVRWVAPLLEGSTIAEVGDSLDGDLLGDDPLGAWTAASAEALEVAGRPGALDRAVHLSMGETAAAEYLAQLASDGAIHSWDLSRAIGAPEELDSGLVEFVWAFLEPQAEGWRQAGAFGPRVEVPASADRLTQLLALTGRAR